MAQVSAELEEDERVVFTSRLQRYRGDVLPVIVLHTAVVLDEIQHNGFYLHGALERFLCVVILSCSDRPLERSLGRSKRRLLAYVAAKVAMPV